MISGRDPIDDRHAQFLIAVAELCTAAELAHLDVEIRTVDGDRTEGVPRSLRAGAFERGDETDYSTAFCVSDRLVRLSDIVECTLCAPDTTD